MSKRSYKQNCALARALDLVGDRWTFLIIRELLIAPKRYKTLVEHLKGMGTNLLANRLKELEQYEIIERSEISGSKLTSYQLTEFGRELEAPVLAIIRWGFKLPHVEQSEYLSVNEWDLVAMKAAFRPELAAGLQVNAAFSCGTLDFCVSVAEQQISIVLGHDNPPDISITAQIGTLMAIEAGTLSFEQARLSKQLLFAGDEALVRQLLGCFKVSG